MDLHALRRTVLRTRRVAVALQGFMAACVVRPSGDDGAGSASSTAEATSAVSTIGTPTTTEALTGSGPPSDTTVIGGGDTSITADSGSTFLITPDMSGSAECDPSAEMPCPEGQKCSVASEIGFIWIGPPACFPILGDKQHGEACDLGENPFDGLDDCAAGLTCIDLYLPINDEPLAVCAPFCNPPIPYWDEPYSCEKPDETCFIPSCQECQLSFCTPTCDPLVPECPQDMRCDPFGNAFFCYGGYDDIDLPGPGEPCDQFYLCDSGTQCVAAEQVASPACADAEVCCAPYCDLNAANNCPGKDLGETCEPFFPEAFDPATHPWGEKYNKLGLCQLL